MIARPGPRDLILPLRARILRPGRPLESALFDGDEDGEHWGLWDGDALLACLSLLRGAHPLHPEHPVWLRGMAAEVPGRGFGGRLLAAVHHARPAAMWCNARLAAVPFYERLGWRIVSPEFDIAGVGPHHRMLREAGDAT